MSLWMMRSSSPSRPMRWIPVALAGLFVGFMLSCPSTTLGQQEKQPPSVEDDVTQGALRIVRGEGDDREIIECPLKHTDVQAEISGFIARVKLTQTFTNPTDEKIEAVYVFPLPHQSAVDDMTMVIGQRRIVGQIKRRDVAKDIYQQALSAGHTAALLEQQRPNIFRQSVGNIEPGQEVKVEISYVDVLKYDMGSYEFYFPMVVGPRYTPSGGVEPDPSGRINPPVLHPDQRTGHDIDLQVSLNAGVPVQNLKVANHKATVDRRGDALANVTLGAGDRIPNKDFVLKYDVVGKKPEMAVLAHTGDYTGDASRHGIGYFMLMVQPSEDERLTKSPPREIVFLIDVSGSMSGRPTEKVKESMQHMLELCRPEDTLQVVTFAGRAHQLFDQPVPANEENIKKALSFSRRQKGGGGTEMLRGVQKAIDQPIDKDRLRVVVMLTDGYIGNEAQIIEHIGEHCGDQIRFWAIGIGQAPNMFLIDGVARQGGGMGKRLGLDEETKPLTVEIMTRIQRAQLAKVNIDWGDLQVTETFPAKIPELWAGRPIILFGRYQQGGTDSIKIQGSAEGEPVSWSLDVSFPEELSDHDVLAKTWARQKIEDLMHQSFYAGSPAVEEEVTGIALNYRLMSQYTSFVAVDPASMPVVDPARPPRQMIVPVPLPEGTRWEGFFGGEMRADFADDRFLVDQLGKIAMDKSSSIRGGFGGGGGLGGSHFGRGAAPMGGGALAPSSSFALPSAAPAQRARMSGAQRQLRLQENQSLARGGGRGRLGYLQGQFAQEHSRATLAPAKMGLKLSASLEAEEKRVSNLSTAVPQGFVNEKVELLQQQVKKLVEQAKAHSKASELDKARSAWIQAYFLDLVASSQTYSPATASQEALDAIREIDRKLASQWVKQLPMLEDRLDLVIRDASLQQAIELLAQHSGLKISVASGSIQDSAALLHTDQVRVPFLDLRGATAIEGLNWLLQPVRMNWMVKEGQVVVSTDRRSPRLSGWVYDVSSFFVPLKEELKDKNPSQLQELATTNAKQFLAAVHSQANLQTGHQALWYSPGQILVLGMPEQHAAVQSLLTNLENEAWQPDESIKEICQLAQKRFAARTALLNKLELIRKRYQILATMDQYALELLAAAADDRLHLEALTQLQIAWSNLEADKSFAEELIPQLCRTSWLVSMAAELLPRERELAELAQTARHRCAPMSLRAVKQLSDKPEDVRAMLTVIYGMLAGVNSSADQDAAAQAIAGALGKQENLKLFAQLALTCMQRDHGLSAEQFNALIKKGTQADDLVILLALNCRSRGQSTWDQFRSASRYWIGKQPLRGETVVFVNRLHQKRFASFAIND